jgi:hypothetical protein
MTDPESWPLWVQILLFSPIRVRYVFRWRSTIGYAIVAVVAFGLLVF